MRIRVEVREGEEIIWSSENRSMADALEPGGEEGRDKLRKATERSTYPETRGLPNGVTRRERSLHLAHE